ncbi:MAG: Kdo hydroxylase family protein, partial [Janthinobacterium lividum]
MDQQIVEIPDYHATPAGGSSPWQDDPALIAALEAGKLLYFPSFGFTPLASERSLFSPAIRDPKKRNISLDASGALHGALGDEATQAALAAMIGRFRLQAQELIAHLFPGYTGGLKLAPTSFRPAEVEDRVQSWRADDRRLHVDAFPSRPNHGERLLRVFTNVNPHGQPRVWRVGEPFQDVA